MGQPECYFQIDYNRCHDHLNIISINPENLYASWNPKLMTVAVSIYEILTQCQVWYKRVPLKFPHLILFETRCSRYNYFSIINEEPEPCGY